MGWRDVMHYSRAQQRAIVILMVLIVGVLIVGECTKSSPESPPPSGQALLALRDSVRQRTTNRRPYIVKDTIRIYVRDTVRRRMPYQNQDKRQRASLLDSTKTDTLRRYTRVEKYAAGTTICLNAADTSALKKIPGIGSVLARKIIRYRQRLGGYYSVDQLTEIQLLADSLRPWLTVDTTLIQPITINRSSIERLTTHPYLSFSQARVIVEHRRKRGNIRSLQQLCGYDEFTPEDMDRLRHYIRLD